MTYALIYLHLILNIAVVIKWDISQCFLSPCELCNKQRARFCLIDEETESQGSEISIKSHPLSVATETY